MFLYFDRQGTLKEQINNDVIRAESSGVNKIYIFWEENEKLSNWVNYRVNDISYKFYRKDNSVSLEYIGGQKEVAQIPYNSKQDLKFFEYYKDYNFYTFTIPGNELAVSQALSCLVKIIDNNQSTITSLGLFSFMVDGDTKRVLLDEHITIAQWNFLLTKLGSVKGIDDYNLLLNIPIENADFTNLQPQNNTFYRCTGGESDSIKLGRIYFYNGNRYIDIVNEDIDLSNYYNKQETTEEIELKLKELSQDDIKDGETYKRVTQAEKDQWNRGGGTSTDVQINGVSITENGVANIPYASGDKAGLFKSNAASGIFIDGNSGSGSIVAATNAAIDAKTQKFQPIVPSNLDYAVKKGLIGSANKSQTDINFELSDGEKTSVLAWLGIESGGGGGTQLYLHQVNIHGNEYNSDTVHIPAFDLVVNIISSKNTAYTNNDLNFVLTNWYKLASVSFSNTTDKVYLGSFLPTMFFIADGTYHLEVIVIINQVNTPTDQRLLLLGSSDWVSITNDNFSAL